MPCTIQKSCLSILYFHCELFPETEVWGRWADVFARGINSILLGRHTLFFIPSDIICRKIGAPPFSIRLSHYLCQYASIFTLALSFYCSMLFTLLLEEKTLWTNIADPHEEQGGRDATFRPAFLSAGFPYGERGMINGCALKTATPLWMCLFSIIYAGLTV